MQAVLFDMDGVIVDTEKYWHRMERELFEEELDADTDKVMEEVTGRNYRETYEILVDEYGLEMTKEEFLGKYDETAEIIYGERAEMMEGFPHIVKDLRENDVKLGVVSASPRRWIGEVIERFDLASMFDLFLSTEEIDGEGKPEPAVYLHAAEELGVEPGRCVVVEDSENGIEAAKKAGMYCIGYRNDNREADAVANSPEDLKQKLTEAAGEGF